MRRGLTLPIEHRAHVVVKAFNGDPTIFVVKARNEPRSRIAGFMTAPPNTPECKSCVGPCTLNSRAAMPRREKVRW